ncbi:MAG: hypothetical protein NC911_08925 [Candidatus Omnitrophica bacterium]|nr:hypothetical protein [Candidatus Omnitrophota bacterium]
MDDLRKVRESIYQMLQEAAPYDHFILCLTAYPHRAIVQTRFVLNCVRQFDKDRKKIS